MKKAEIVVGGRYVMRVSGREVPVRVNYIRTVPGYVGLLRRGRDKTVYECTNLVTGRDCRAQSAAKFRRTVPEGV